MRVTIQTHGIQSSEALAEHGERRLGTAIGRYGHRVGDVLVHLTDVNGPRGGRDIECRIVATIPGRPPVVVHAVADDAYAAIDLAAAKAEAAVSRGLGRARRHVRSPALPLS